MGWKQTASQVISALTGKRPEPPKPTTTVTTTPAQKLPTPTPTSKPTTPSAPSPPKKPTTAQRVTRALTGGGGGTSEVVAKKLDTFASLDTSKTILTTTSPQIIKMQRVEMMEEKKTPEGVVQTLTEYRVTGGKQTPKFTPSQIISGEAKAEPVTQTITTKEVKRPPTFGGFVKGTVGAIASYTPKMSIYEEGKGWAGLQKTKAFEGVTTAEWIGGGLIASAPALIKLPSAFSSMKVTYKTSGITGVGQDIIGGASPIQLVSKTYIAPTEFRNVKGVLSSNQKTLIYGETQSKFNAPTKLTGGQTLKYMGQEPVAVGRYKVSQEFFKISAGGGRVETGVRSFGEPYVLRLDRAGAGTYVSERGGAKLIIKEGTTALQGRMYSLGRIETMQTKNIISGTADFSKIRISKTATLFAPTGKTGIYQFFGGQLKLGETSIKGLPEGTYRFNVGMSGKQFRMGEISGREAGTTIIGGGKKSSSFFLKSLYAKEVVSTAPTIKTVSAQTTTTPTQTSGVLLGSQVATTKQKVITKQTQVQKTMLSTSQSFMFAQPTKTTQIMMPSQKTIPSFATAQFQTPVAVQTPELIQTPVAVQTTGTTTATPSFFITSPPPSPTPIYPPFIPILKFGFEETTRVKKIPQRKPRYRYTPSFEAIVKNIKGKAPSRITGLEIRPITKGFKWFSKGKLF